MLLRDIGSFLGAAFTYDWIWENAQAFLYKGYIGFMQHLWGCTVAAFGDVALVALIHGAVALFTLDCLWHRRATRSHYLAAISAGVPLAVLVEYVALDSGRWAYAGMPLIPFTGVGLIPVLQMVIVPALVFRAMGTAARGFKRKR